MNAPRLPISRGRAPTWNTAQATYDRAQADLARMKPLVEKAEISRHAVRFLCRRGPRGRKRIASGQGQAHWRDSGRRDQESGAMRQRAGPRRRRRTPAVAEAQANQQQVNVRTADAASAAANVTQARANLETAELNLSYTTIVAPMDGVVTKKIRRSRPDRAARPGPDDDRPAAMTSGSPPTSKRRSWPMCTPAKAPR